MQHNIRPFDWPARDPPAKANKPDAPDKAKNKRFADTVIRVSFVFVSIYTVVSTIGFYAYGMEPTTLTTCVFSLFGAEAIGLLAKRIFGNRRQDYSGFGGYGMTDYSGGFGQTLGSQNLYGGDGLG
jgi:hypothetical protein